jgi:hypothetical protein
MEGAIIAWSTFRFIDIILCRQKTSSYMSKKPDKPNPQREQKDPVPLIDPESPPSNNPSVPDDFSAKVAERKTPLFDSIHIVRGESIGQPTIHSANLHVYPSASSNEMLVDRHRVRATNHNRRVCERLNPGDMHARPGGGSREKIILHERRLASSCASNGSLHRRVPCTVGEPDKASPRGWLAMVRGLQPALFWKARGVYRAVGVAIGA